MTFEEVTFGRKEDPTWALRMSRVDKGRSGEGKTVTSWKVWGKRR